MANLMGGFLLYNTWNYIFIISHFLDKCGTRFKYMRGIDHL